MDELVTYRAVVAATTNVDFPIGHADALLVTATLSSGITLTLFDGSTVAAGNQTIGTYIRIACTKAVFAAGGVLAMRA